tara:strand:+ start:6449 stop:6691 length:243 start_codon:yes stop_codon:yes gene_type:complete
MIESIMKGLAIVAEKIGFYVPNVVAHDMAADIEAKAEQKQRFGIFSQNEQAVAKDVAFKKEMEDAENIYDDAIDDDWEES